MPANDQQPRLDRDGRGRVPDLTGLLQAWSDGDPAALAVLAPLVDRELHELASRILASERDGRWRPTELLQETYLRLLDWRTVRWQNRAHFFATAARMMRHAIVDERGVCHHSRACGRGAAAFIQLSDTGWDGTIGAQQLCAKLGFRRTLIEMPASSSAHDPAQAHVTPGAAMSSYRLKGFLRGGASW